ncbi:hypothetical protein AB2L57_18275 (plasmid) [Microbacterium sp. HA-8]|uniref:hypothetical protein n=1 Tax=Microbacterium sp. HA-8 TaxID=3234200 RepID=UPI0038F7145F
MADRDSLLDDLLSSSKPPVSALTPDIEDELARMSVMALTDQRRPRGHRHISRAAAVGLCTALVLGGAGAAAAATLTGWPWWKQEPPAPFSYTLPSGAVCETRLVGNIQGPSPEISTATLAYLASVDIFEVLDVDAELTKLRESGQDQPRAGSTVLEGSRPNYFLEDAELSPDREYQFAVENAIIPAVVLELKRQGFEVSADQFSWQSATDCPGAQW